MPSSQEFELDLEAMRKRFRIVIAAVMFGAFAMIAAIVIGAFVVVDERALQAFKDEPRIVHAEKKRTSSANSSRTTVSRGGSRPAEGAPASRTALSASTETETMGSAAASPRVAAPLPQQNITGETGPSPDTMLDNQQNLRENKHHGRKKNGRRLARWRSRAPDHGGPSALFFPFR